MFIDHPRPAITLRGVGASRNHSYAELFEHTPRLFRWQYCESVRVFLRRDESPLKAKAIVRWWTV